MTVQVAHMGTGPGRPACHKLRETFADAVADIESGSTIGIGGFLGAGAPVNLIAALSTLPIGALTCVASSARDDVTEPPGAPSIGQLAQKGMLAKMISAAVTGVNVSLPMPFTRYHEEGLIEAELVPQGTLAERLRAAGAGIPAIYTPAGIGTEIEAGKEIRHFGGRPYLMEHALPLDYAFIRAARADRYGNLRFDTSQRNFNPVMAMAARTTIVEVEQPIVDRIDPDDVHLAGIFVHRMVVVPPTGYHSGRTTQLQRGKARKIEGLSRQQMCDRLVREFPKGALINLGIGLPGLCARSAAIDPSVVFFSENGVIGVGEPPRASDVNMNLVNAGGEPISLRPGAAIVHQADSFAIIRSGKVDITVLGAYEVSAQGDLASWKIQGMKGGRMGGAMDLAASARKVFVVMEHTARDGTPRLVSRPTLPVTGRRCVGLLMTNFGLFEPSGGAFILREIAPGVSVDEIRARTAADVLVSNALTTITAD